MNPTKSKRKTSRKTLSRNLVKKLIKLTRRIRNCSSKKCKNYKLGTKDLENCILKNCKKDSKTLKKLIKEETRKNKK